MRLMQGFTLIELMTAITIFAILAMMAMPMYGSFIANSQIRTATESMLSGVRLAQTEAVKRNAQVEFVLDENVGWTVNVVDGGVATKLQDAQFKAGAAKTKRTPSGPERRVTFNGLGRILAQNPVDNSPPLGRVDVTSTAYTSGARDLRLVVGSAYGIKVCDPALPDTDPAGCP